MAEINIEKMAQDVAEKALDDFLYDGKSIREWMKIICEADFIGNWIPVSERLPENSGTYLITYCHRDKIETQEAVYVKGEEDKWLDITGVEITLAVIAWMPLPEPYKAESEDTFSDYPNMPYQFDNMTGSMNL